ncbi:MAG: type II toxin-antitoxin system death-on-curing family toxin [Oscillochloris sp.]|nr:type II toxin-antitoxin system death-on-curing family toxin [Oscillochloris sp.]
MMSLTAHELLVIHQALIEEFGGMAGITEAGFTRLETTAAVPMQSAFGEEIYPDPVAKAGALAHAIARNHPFSDGNKRVAVAALDLVLRLHGIELSADNRSLYDLAMAMAEGMSRDAVIDWVQAHSRRAA